MAQPPQPPQPPRPDWQQPWPGPSPQNPYPARQVPTPQPPGAQPPGQQYPAQPNPAQPHPVGGPASGYRPQRPGALQRPGDEPVAPPAPVPPVRLPEPPEVVAPFPRHDIPVVTLEALPGRRIVEVLGSVEGCVTRSRELSPRADLSQILMVTRQDAVDAMVALAVQAGADAVVGLRFDTSAISSGASEVCAYGTAVRLAGA